MKVPKYIEEALNKRIKYAELFNHYDWIVSDYCDKHHIYVEGYDLHGGCESIVNPSSSADRVYKAICNKN